MSDNKTKQIKSMIARRISEVRVSKGISQEALSEASGLHQSTISQYEAGNITLSVPTLMSVCDGLGCTVDYLLGRDVDYDTDSLRGRLFKAFSSMSAESQHRAVRMLEFLVSEEPGPFIKVPK